MAPLSCRVAFIFSRPALIELLWAAATIFPHSSAGKSARGWGRQGGACRIQRRAVGRRADPPNPLVSWALIPSCAASNENAPCGAFSIAGGEGGIRTHDPREGTPVFKSQDPHIRVTYAHVSYWNCRVGQWSVDTEIADLLSQVQLERNSKYPPLLRIRGCGWKCGGTHPTPGPQNFS